MWVVMPDGTRYSAHCARQISYEILRPVHTSAAMRLLRCRCDRFTNQIAGEGIENSIGVLLGVPIFELKSHQILRSPIRDEDVAPSDIEGILVEVGRYIVVAHSRSLFGVDRNEDKARFEGGPNDVAGIGSVECKYLLEPL